MNNLKSYLYLTNINKNTLSVLNPYSWKDLISVNRSELLIFSSSITFMILIFFKIRIYITTFNSDILIWKRNVVKGFNFVQNMFWRENELNICNAQVKLQEMFTVFIIFISHMNLCTKKGPDSEYISRRLVLLQVVVVSFKVT